MAGDNKDIDDIKDKYKEVDADTTMDVVDVDLVVETTKVPLVTKVYPNTKATIMVAKITIGNNGNNGNNSQHYNDGTPGKNGNNQY